jgi:putative transposase
MKIKRFRFPKDIIMLSVRWYLRYGLSYRDLEEMLEERGVFLDHTSIFRWVIRFTPVLLSVFLKKKRPVGGRWRMDETYIKVNGLDRYLYRALDKEGQTIDFLLTAHRDQNAARRFLEKAVKNCKKPSLINIDQSGANTAGIKTYNDQNFACIEIRQCKYLNNILEQDHRNIKRRTRPMLGFKSFWSARVVLAGIELVNMIKEGQLKTSRKSSSLSPADQFYSLAA